MPLLEQAATQTPHSLHFQGVTTTRVWPSGRSSSLSAPERQAFSHLPQPKRQRIPSLPHLPPRQQQLFLLQKQHLHPKRIDAAANQCYTQL